jgi:hypothetical protein
VVAQLHQWHSGGDKALARHSRSFSGESQQSDQQSLEVCVLRSLLPCLLPPTASWLVSSQPNGCRLLLDGRRLLGYKRLAATGAGLATGTSASVVLRTGADSTERNFFFV